MKTHIKDALQVTLAIVLTGGMIASAAPLPITPSQASMTSEVTATEKSPTPVVEEKTVEPTPVEVVPTWESNPNKCDQNTQYIAKDAPFSCIDKPIEAPQTAPKTTSSASFGGSCDSWIAEAGISDVANANELIRRESGCNPNAVNPSSGACGVAQELPCGKSGCSLGDGACQVRWMNSYVTGRYGSWQAAVSFHDSHNWY